MAFKSPEQVDQQAAELAVELNTLLLDKTSIEIAAALKYVGINARASLVKGIENAGWDLKKEADDYFNPEKHQ